MKFSLALTTMMVASATAFTTPSLMSSSPTTALSLSEVAAETPVATYESKRDTEDKLRQAEKIGAANKQFEKYVTLLTAYKAEKGDCNVPEDYEENTSLGQWLYSQRKSRKQGKMDPDKVAKLEDLGVVWSLRSLMVKKE